MENPKQEKVAVVEEVEKRLNDATSVVVTEYRGLTVDQLAELRKALRPAGGSYKIYKNTLVRRAASNADVDISEHLAGPTALAFTETTPGGEPGDVVVVAKALRDFAKENPQLVLKGGLFEGNPLSIEDINALAELEPREVLLAKFAGLLQAPMSQFARLLQAVPQNFAYGLQALIDEQGGVPESAASDTSEGAAEAPTDEVAAEASAEADVSENDKKAEAAEAEVTEETAVETPEAVAEAPADSPEPESEA